MLDPFLIQVSYTGSKACWLAAAYSLSCPVVESASFKLISGPKTQILIQLCLIIYLLLHEFRVYQ